MKQRELKLYSTMIETLRHDPKNYKDADELLTILSYSEIELSNAGVYANKPGHFRKDVNIRVKIPLLTKARSLKQSFGPLIVDCYSEDNTYELDDINIKSKQISSLDDLEIRSNRAIFSRILDEIIQSIRMGKHSIWISIAWFTDEALYQELYNQQTKGVHIRILISNEQQNQGMIPKLKEKFETIVVNRWGTTNIIDYILSTVLLIILLFYMVHLIGRLQTE
ncbi:hypothetical protein FJ659_24650 [Bacillus dicomae]|uniref:Uncharacterized protein n=1 Tax=Bacillus dicomae TaxID=3088378 RepID=A0AC61SZZ7_9BACI|nr:phospholipase D-like domain-containing protein [Bacillus dicomae]TPV39567.1 hypothetical protein FJ659_24650 [Bacillus dicomae]